jgi:hypothetical protein
MQRMLIHQNPRIKDSRLNELALKQTLLTQVADDEQFQNNGLPLALTIDRYMLDTSRPNKSTKYPS